MNIVEHIDKYNKGCVFFCDPIKNNVMNEGYFIRILYSTTLFIMSGISLFLSFNDVIIEKYYNKYKCTYNPAYHKSMIDDIKDIEDTLLKNVTIKNKIPQCKIVEQLRSGNIKFFSETIDKTNNLFMLKISGIWETDYYYGITYKFVKINNT
jgi:hypothetical protein